jgi:hypothetical protein
VPHIGGLRRAWLGWAASEISKVRWMGHHLLREDLAELVRFRENICGGTRRTRLFTATTLADVAHPEG